MQRIEENSSASRTRRNCGGDSIDFSMSSCQTEHRNVGKDRRDFWKGFSFRHRVEAILSVQISTSASSNSYSFFAKNLLEGNCNSALSANAMIIYIAVKKIRKSL